MSKGYQLADGSWSSEYKIGDRFVVRERCSHFEQYSIVEFYEDDESSAPLFKAISGWCEYSNCYGEAGGFLDWEMVEPIQKSFTKADLKCGMRVTHNGGDEYYVLDGMLVEVITVDYTPDCLDVFGSVEVYDEDLNHIRHRNCDIIKVVDRDGTVLFEREAIEQKLVLVTDEVREMTIGEIQARLGFHVKIVEE